MISFSCVPEHVKSSSCCRCIFSTTFAFVSCYNQRPPIHFPLFKSVKLTRNPISLLMKNADTYMDDIPFQKRFVDSFASLLASHFVVIPCTSLRWLWMNITHTRPHTWDKKHMWPSHCHVFERREIWQTVLRNQFWGHWISTNPSQKTCQWVVLIITHGAVAR